MTNDWYESLVRPPLTPPNWIFAPVWTILYVMIAFSLVLFLKSYSSREGYWIYLLIVLHLASNFAWTGLFFGLNAPGWALVDIFLLDITLMLMIWKFWHTNALSGVLLCPYLVWVLIATYLNAGFFWLNRT